MIYLVIGIFVVVAVSAFFRQQSQTKQNEQNSEDAAPVDPSSLDLPDEDGDENTNSAAAESNNRCKYGRTRPDQILPARL